MKEPNDGPESPKAQRDHRMASRLRSLSPISPYHPGNLSSDLPTQPVLPHDDLRAQIVAKPLRLTWWQRLRSWFGLPLLGFTAVAVPMATPPTVVNAQTATPKESPMTGLEKTAGHVMSLLEQSKQHELVRSENKDGTNIFDKILSHVAEHAVDMTIDACLTLAATGVWRAVRRVGAIQLSRNILFGKSTNTEASLDLDDANLRQVAASVSPEDKWLISPGDDDGKQLLSAADAFRQAQSSQHRIPTDTDFLTAGRRFVTNMAKRIKPKICGEKSIAHQSVEDTTKWIGGELRKDLLKGDVSEGVAWAISGVAAAIAKLGLETYCSKKDEAWFD